MFYSVLLLLPQSVIAEVDLTSMSDVNPAHLSSIPLLQSLKINNQQLQFNAPYVHELKNRYKVRSLFVESKICLWSIFNSPLMQVPREMKRLLPGLYGIATMAAKLINEGTEQYTANDSRAFERVGAKFSAVIGICSSNLSILKIAGFSHDGSFKSFDLLKIQY